MRLIAIVVIVVIAWQIFLTIGASSRMTPQLAAAVESQDDFEIVVRFSFDAESFHLRYLQEFGVITATEERAITVRRVDSADVRRIARQYWIDSLDLAVAS